MPARSFSASCLAILFAASILATGQAQEKVLYSFGTNPNDGYIPNGGLVFDKAGNVYGTTQFGGTGCSEECGVAFELSPSPNGVWTETILYNFCAECPDGQSPRAGLIFDASGNLYGTTRFGGAYDDAGTVFELSPPSAPGGSWTETVLWSFGGPGDGGAPYCKLTWDASGNLYGTALGGPLGYGMVFELSPSSNGWTEKVLYNFCLDYPDCSDGAAPMAGVTFDKSGNLYGTTFAGGKKHSEGWGVVYELSPTQGGDWTERVLHIFTAENGGEPLSDVNFDTAGNFYGTFSTAGPNSPGGCGGVFRASPTQTGWRTGIFQFNGTDGCIPLAGVFVDNKTNTLYGTTESGSYPYGGTVFKMTGTKGEAVLYRFCEQCGDGFEPNSSLTPNAGKLYGTTIEGGTGGSCGQLGCGTVFQIAP